MIFIGIILLIIASLLHILYAANLIMRPVERPEFFTNEMNLLLTFILSIIIALVGAIFVWIDTNLFIAIILLGVYWFSPKYFT